MKKVLLWLIAVFFVVSCSNIYSPTGIKGKDAKKEIEDLSGNLSLLTFPTLLSSTTSFLSTSICATEDSASIGSTNASTTSNFTLPTLNNYGDLDARAGGTLHFRSSPNTDPVTTSYALSVIGTASTTNSATCTYTSSAGACAGAITAGSSIFSFSSSITVSANHCLAVRCTTAAYLRIQPSASTYFSSISSSFNFGTFISLLLGPDIFKSITGIKDDTYYTRESFEKCKQGITNITLIQSAINTASSAVLKDVISCNKPYSLVPPTLDSSTAAALQGNECKLEEVNFIGF